VQQRLGVVPEEPDEEELLLARGEALRLLPHVFERDRLVRDHFVTDDQLQCPSHAGVDVARRRAVRARDELAQLVDDHEVALRRKHMDERL